MIAVFDDRICGRAAQTVCAKMIWDVTISMCAESLQFGMVSPTWSCYCILHTVQYLELWERVGTLLVRPQSPTGEVRTFKDALRSDPYTLIDLYISHAFSVFLLDTKMSGAAASASASKFQSFMNHPAGTLPERGSHTRAHELT